MSRWSNLTCLVTGATSGIGEQVVTRLAAVGADVLGVARTAERGYGAETRVRSRAPDARLQYLSADLAELGQTRALADQVTALRDRLDVLVLNAAVARPRCELTAEGFEVDFATNHLSGFLLTQMLGDLLKRSAPSRVVTVSSAAHRHVTDVDLDALVTGRSFHHMRTYSTTKLLNIWFTRELDRRVGVHGVTATAADPGFARTRLGRDAPGAFGWFLTAARPFQLDPLRAATTPVYLATADELTGVGGGFYTKCRATAPSALAQDAARAGRLWELSETLTRTEETAR